MLRKIIFWIHLGAGLTAGGVVLVMAATGITMSFEPQLLKILERNVREVKVPENASRMSLDELAQRASVLKKDARLEGFTVSSDPSASVVMNFGRKDFLYLDPYRGNILGGETRAHQFFQQVEDLHRRLALKEKGRVITGAANAFMLFLAVSGLYLWWPRNWHKNALKKTMLFQNGLTGRPRDWNWHNVIGFWCLPLILMTTLSGLIMSYSWANDFLFRLAGSEPPAPRRREAPAAKKQEPSSAPAPGVPLEVFFKEAAVKSESWNSISIRLPEKTGQPVNALIFEKSSPGYPKARSLLSLDAQTGQALRWEPYTDHSRGRVWRSWVRNLHTGEALGPVGQIFVLAGGMGTLLLIWTGFAMSWRRFFKTRENRFKAGFQLEETRLV